MCDGCEIFVGREMLIMAKDDIEQANSNMATSIPKVTPDQEAWVRDRLWTLARVVDVIVRERRVGADGPIIDSAVSGAINGCAVEVIRTLGLENAFVNLEKPIKLHPPERREVVPNESISSQ